MRNQLKSKTSYGKTLLVFFSLILIMFPIGICVDIFLPIVFDMMDNYTYGATESIIPFGLFPEYGVPIMTILRGLFSSFLKTLVPLYVVALIFQKIFVQVNWKLICVFFFFSFCFLFYVFYGTRYIPADPSLVGLTIIMTAVFISISYLMLFNKRQDFDEI